MEVQLFHKSKSLLNKLGSKENPCHNSLLLTSILLLDKMISKESPCEELIVRGWGRDEGSGERERGETKVLTGLESLLYGLTHVLIACNHGSSALLQKQIPTKQAWV